MGIYGFGALRERFAERVLNFGSDAQQYVVCMDITSFVVTAVRSSVTETDFLSTLRNILDNCTEMQHLRKYPPYALCFTLDNRAPAAKRQTQLQRRVESRPVLLRVSNVTREDECVKRIKTKDDADNATEAPPPPSFDQSVVQPLQIRDLASSIRTFVLRRFSDLVKTNDSSETDWWRQTERLDATNCSADADRVQFDYNEGEGEIKAIKWLRGYADMDKLIMSRDNDVFVYVLSVLQTARRDSSRFLVFHEHSNSVLSCWNHLSTYHDRCWLLLLWMSMCFGNDFTHGLLDKSYKCIKYHYDLLERKFLAVADKTMVLSSELFDRSLEHRLQLINDDERATYVLAEAMCSLQSVLRRDKFLQDVTALRKRCRNGATKRSSFRDESPEDFVRDKLIDDETLRTWLAREAWSFFYLMELPSEFSHNQTFEHCPSIRINAVFSKPYLSLKEFLTLDPDRIRRLMRSVLKEGV